MSEEGDKEAEDSYSEYDSSDDSETDIQNLFGNVSPEQAVRNCVSLLLIR